MTNTIPDMVKTPVKKEDIEDMSESLNEMSKEKDNSIIEITSDITLQESAQSLADQATSFFQTDTLLQAGSILILTLISYAIAVILQKKLKSLIKLDSEEGVDLISKTGSTWILRLCRVLFPALLALALMFSNQTAGWMKWSNDLLRVAMNLSVAAFAVRFISTFLTSKIIAKWVAIFVWSIAALHIVGWWSATTELLDSIRFGLGSNKISLLTIIKGASYFIAFLWLAKVTANTAERKIKKIEGLTPSLRVLFSKLLKIALIVTALMFGLNALGVDLTSFAVFGGAIGVGLGFGLQKVVSNFISGIILLLDRSIKPGDVIAIGNSFGWVNTLGARYVSIIQRDGKEHLIPNELLITEKVENWSFSNNDIRLSIDVGVAYDTDLHKALDLCLDAAIEEPRVKQSPKPVVRVTDFGESSVNIQIRGWINDPVNGVGNIKSDLLLSVWDKFHEHNIEIPYPQRDLHVKSIDPKVFKEMYAGAKAT